MKPRSFATAKDYKKGSRRASITWPESVDEALSVGWIDGLRRRIDEHSYMIRFTPRKASSIWSAVNTRRAAELMKEGRMRPAGARAFEGRDPKKTNRYSFEQRQAPNSHRRSRSDSRPTARRGSSFSRSLTATGVSPSST